ncbi:MAG: class I SAM-dependent methyltransferase [Bacteroidales bacterium]
MNKTQHRYDRIARYYEILEAPMELIFSQWRRTFLSKTSGRTLEVGVGTGRSIPFYPEDVDLTGIDISSKMVEISKKKLRKHPRPNTRIIQMNAEEMAFADNTFDTVVTACVFCSVPNPVQGLKEIKRVCRHGGKVLMLEHVRSQNKVMGKFMDIMNPIPLYIIGDNINRGTYQNLLKAGFKPEQIEVKHIWFDIVKHFQINNTNGTL